MAEQRSLFRICLKAADCQSKTGHRFTVAYANLTTTEKCQTAFNNTPCQQKNVVVVTVPSDCKMIKSICIHSI